MSGKLKKEISAKFSRAASSYHKNAAPQMLSALSLYKLVKEFELTNNCNLKSDSKLLEIGCGTGIFTEYLIRKYPSNPLLITDISSEMIKECCSRISPLRKNNICFETRDGEHVPCNDKFGRIFSAFTLHWFENPLVSIKNLFLNLEEGGFVAHSFPLSTSFKEWEMIANECSIPYTANAFPELSQVKKQINELTENSLLHVEEIPCTYNSSLEFFQHLKQIGATTSNQRISGEKLRKLVTYWDKRASSKIVVTFHIAYVLAMRSSI